MRPKLSIPAQIKDMKDAGIRFDIVSEADARRYLEAFTYYFRVKAYAKNYEKYASTEKQGQYINLDFAYLMDLSEIDTILMKIILEMSYELEFFLKVKMLADFNKTDEDGYDIVQELFKMQPALNDSIEEKVKAPLCSDLIMKYKDRWAIWNIVEVLTLGQLTILYGLFYSRNSFSDSYVGLLLPVNMIRNAASHNNCLINRLRPPYSGYITPRYDLRNELSQRALISAKILEKRLTHPAIHDFASLLFLYSRMVPPTVRNQSYSRLKDLFYRRIPENKEYYSKNESLRACYDFVLKIVDFYIDN